MNTFSWNDDESPGPAKKAYLPVIRLTGMPFFGSYEDSEGSDVQMLDLIVDDQARESPVSGDLSVPCRPGASPGNVVDSRYEVLEKGRSGEYGHVLTVRHLLWNIPVSVTVLKDSLLHDGCSVPGSRNGTISALWDPWISLGLHPHIACCYYVHTFDGRPAIFSEHLEGGNLRTWLEGGMGIKEILRLCLQCLDGLCHAHQKGVIHGDLRLEKCLLTDEGLLKIADFAVRQGFLDIAAGEYLPPEGSHRAPELRDRSLGEAGPWTDIYSFGLMLYELCFNEKPFDEPSFPEAADVPLFLRDFIVTCIRKKPYERFTTAEEARSRLAGIYERVTGEDYPLLIPDAQSLLAGTLNMKALALMDRGREEEALEVWDEALAVIPLHCRVLFNRGLVRWRRGLGDDMDVLASLASVRKERPDQWEVDYLQSLVHLERDDCQAACEILQNALIPSSYSGEVVSALEAARTQLHATSRCIQTISLPYNGVVQRLYMDPKGSLLYATCSDRALRIVDIPSGTVRKTIEDGGWDIALLSLSADGRFGLTRRADGTIKLWDLCSGMARRVIPGFSRHMGGNAFVAVMSGDTRFIAAGGMNGVVRLWDLEAGRFIRSYEGHQDAIMALQFSADGKSIVSGDKRGGIRVWDCESGECALNWTADMEPEGLQFGRYGEVALVWGRGKISICSVMEGLVVWNFVPPPPMERMRFSPDYLGLWIVMAAGQGKGARLWNACGKKCARTLECAEGSVSAILLSDDACQAFVAAENWIKVWHLEPGNFQRLSGFAVSYIRDIPVPEGTQLRYRKLIESVQRAIYDRDQGKAIMMLTEARDMHGYERTPELAKLWLRLYCNCLKTGIHSMVQYRALPGSSSIMNAMLCGDCPWIASLSSDYTLKIWDASSGMCITTIREDWGFVTALAVSGKAIALGHSDGTVSVISPDQRIMPLKGHSNKVNALALSPDQRWLLSGSSDNSVKVWNLDTGSCVRTLEGHGAIVIDVCWAPDSAHVLSSAMDSSLCLWDLERNRLMLKFRGHKSPAGVISVSSDGRSVLSGGDDDFLILWDSSTGDVIRMLPGIEGQVTAVAMTFDRNWAAAVDFTRIKGKTVNILKIWNLTSGIVEKEMEIEEESHIASLVWSPDGSVITVVSRTRTLITVELEWRLGVPAPASWDDSADSLLDLFIAVHRPYEHESFDDPDKAFCRKERPQWNDRDFQKLMDRLSSAGLGWLSPASVSDRLEQRAALSGSQTAGLRGLQ